MTIDNTTISFFSVVTSNLNLIIPFFTAMVGIVIGYVLTKHYQKLNNQREKAKEITKEFRQNFLEILKEQIEMVEKSQYLAIQEGPFKITLKLDENILKNYLVNTGLFKKENGILIAVYTKDKSFNSYAKKIIENIQIYESNLNRYRHCIDQLNSLIPYPVFETEIGILFRSRYDSEVSKEQRWSFFLKVLYVVGLTGCRKVYPDGRSWVVELSRDNIFELQVIIQKDANSKKLADEISTISQNIKISLTNVRDAVLDLHTNWQNTRYI